ncbi:MAG: hypothetical protein JXM73_00010, partial [Anaerolineae bacterium]|nr:hypothetical protein [Anaerolineae bacterium]
EVVYDGELDQFLVLWKDGCKAYQERSGWYRNEAWDVWGVDVSTGGSVGDEVRITDEEATEDSPVGAYAYPAEGTGDPDEGLYLVVWRYCEGNDCDVHGRRVAIEKGEFEVYNETITIASGSGRQQSPDVAYQPGLGRWVVVWEDDAGHRQGMGSNHCDGGDHHFATGGGLSIRAETDWTDECGDALYARAHGDGSAG